MSELTPGEARAVAALLACTSYDAASRQSGVPLRTLLRWRKRPAFVAALNGERRALFESVADALRAAGRDAVAALKDVLADPESAPGVKVQAASAILQHLFRAVEIFDLSERLAVLEKQELQDDGTDVIDIQ